MTFTLATWNINSVRLREALVCKLMQEEAPDVLCLQEIKTPVEKFPLEQFQALGYRHIVARGQKGYNGVAILSKLPITDVGGRDFATLDDARAIAKPALRHRIALAPELQVEGQSADDVLHALLAKVEAPRQ